MTTIADKLRKASGDFRGEPPQLMHKKSVLDRRLDHAEDLASRRGGIGINAAVELRKILRQIEDDARSQLEATKIDQQEFDRLCARVEGIRNKLARSADNRAERLQARNEERDQLLAGAKAPFELKDLISREDVQKLLAESTPVDLSQLRSVRDLGFSWKKTVTKDGKIKFFLVVPTQQFGVWTKEQYENLRRRAERRSSISTEAAASAASTTTGG